MAQKFDEMMREILGPQTYSPMEAAPIMAAKMDQTELGRELTEYSEKTPEEIVCELYENDHVRTLMLYQACHWALDYAQSGGQLHGSSLSQPDGELSIHRRGISPGLECPLQIHLRSPGQIRQSARIKRIIVEGGEAKGVELEDGRQYLADKAVVSTIDPHQTFFDYVGEGNLEEDFTDMIETYQWEKWSLCNLHLALKVPRTSRPRHRIRM